MLKIKEKMKKAVALATSMLFLFTTVFNGVSYANIKTDNAMEFNEQKEFLSPVLGKITSSKYYDSDEIVINIQDLHCHAQTQRQISSIIDLLEKKYQIKGVYLEGTYKDVNTSWLSGFNDGKNGSAIIEKMVDDGRLSGTEYYSLINNKKDFIKPIEDEQLYKENIRLLNEIIVNNQEVEIICNELEEQIKSIKKSYSSDKARKFDKLINDFKAKKIDSKKYYQELAKFAKEKNIDVTKYSNVALYIKLMENNASLNESKIGEELSRFLVEIKNKLPYQEYVSLVKKSNNFSKIENITNQLIKLNNQYQITKNLKLRNLESFISYLDFNDKINPVSFIEEEKALKEEIFIKLGRTKYEQEVAFLNDFVSNIREYFTANISAQEYYKFEGEYKKFRTIWPSYFSVNTVKKLDKYQELLSKYHGNNIKRDYEFAKRIITKNNEKGSLIVKETKLAVEEIEKNIKNKKVKVVVTGGFHTRGLEKILEKNKISYAIITPKITGSIEKAKEIYWNTIIYNATILKNTINLEPLSQETLDISFPKVIASVFETIEQNLSGKYDNTNIKNEVESFINENVITKQDKSNADVEIENWEIESVSPDKTVYRVTYKDNSNKGTIIEKEYIYSHGETVPFSQIDLERTKSMAERTKSRKYAAPSVLLEPGNSARKKINKYILEPLKSVTDGFVSYMDYGQLHMTIGYDLSMLNLPAEEMDDIVRIASPEADIFVQTKNLGQENLKRTSLKGTLKLMPDGVIIYELKDTDLVEQMFNLRDKLTQNSKYTTPSIVHMTIGRITDTNLLDNSPESKQKLAELLRKINEKIYEINEANNLSKIKTRFNIKGGYVSSTGNQDFLVERILPKAEPLNILKKMIDSKSKAVKLALVTVIMPIAEEIVFRILPSLPLVITSFAITTNPILIIPAVITAITGTFVFSYAHTFADKITKQQQIRDWKLLLPKSILLTGVYLCLLIIFPEQNILAPIVTIVMHSLNNFVATKLMKTSFLTVQQNSSSQDNVLDVEINKIIETFKDISKNKVFDYEQERSEFINVFENIGTDKDVIAKRVVELFNFVVQNHKKSKGFVSNNFDLVFLFEPLLNISIHLRDEQDNLLFDRFLDSILEQAADKKNGSSRYFEMLMDSAKYFYKLGQTEYVHKIFDSLYKNKSLVQSMTDYKKFALPVPSPFSFSNVEDWENEIYTIMKEDDAFSVWFMPMLEVLLSSSSEKGDEYSKAYIRALYKSGKQTTPPSIEHKKIGYEWVKEFYNACGVYNEYFNLASSEVLLENKVYKEKISLSNLISKLGYLKIQKTENSNIQDSKFDSVIETLTNALKLSKKEQLQVLQEQVNILYTTLFENKKFDSEILDLLAPVFDVLIKEGKTTFLEDLCNKLIEQGFESSKIDFGFAEMAYIYAFDKEKGLTLIRKKFDESSHTANPLYGQLYGMNWKKFSPKNIEEARQGVPEELRKVIFEYKDLELFYNALGFSFDILEEPSQIFDRDMYIPEYQSLFSFIPKSIQNFKNSSKYFRILKSEQIKSLDVSKEKEDALDRLLKNGNLALASISDSVEDLEKAINFAYKMLQDLKLISSDLEYIHGLEETLDYIKGKAKEGNVEDVLGKEIAWWVKGKSIYSLISDINEKAILETKNISDKFEAFEKVLENNELALSSLTKMTEDSIRDTIYFIEEMLDAFEIISPQIAQKAKISLLEIKKDIENGNVKIETLSKLNSWTEDGLDKIKELHTLINAVHQTSTSKLMTIVESSSNIGGRKVVLRQDGSDQITFYDCSTGPIKDEMKEFLVTLSEINGNSEGQCVIKDNKLIYSKQLGVHSVNILVDMEDGIRVTFNDSGRGDGNALRTTLLATLFAQSGFDITYVDTFVTESITVGGPCKFTAVYNLKNDFNAPEKYAFLFSQALEILSNTKDVDYDLEDGNDVDKGKHYFGDYYIPKLMIEDYRKMKNTFDMPNEFKKGKTGYLVSYWSARIERVKQIRNKFKESKQKEKDKFSDLYDYLEMDTDNVSPWQIVSEYVKGKLIIDKNGILVRNKKYNCIDTLLDVVNKKVDDSLRQAQVINLLDYNSFNYETEGYIGGMVALSGLLRLDGKGWLSVKTAVDKERKRAKFAYVEFVDFEGKRIPLTYGELIDKLKEFGYSVKEQKPRSRSEKEEALTVLKERILLPKDGIYTRGMSVSGQADRYIPVKITYDKNNVDENSMWVVSYTSPEDVSAIIKAGAIMTTTGGMLSHANITARENNKTAILSNGQWIDGKLVVPYYSIESPIEQRRGYEVQKILEHSLVLEEGDVVLANGINGRVLVYKDIPAIYEIQKAIDNNDLNFIKKYIQDHYQDKNIRQVVEYIFLQVVADKEKLKITQFLLSCKKDSEIGIKVSELLKVYIGEKIKALNLYIENEEKIEDINIRYSVISFIQKEMESLLYSYEQEYESVYELEKMIQKVNKHKREVFLEINEYIKNTIRYINKILSSSNLSEQDKDILVKISEKSKVWNFYGNTELKDLISKIDKLVGLETGDTYETEIRDFEDIRAKDVIRYGTKTTELAKLLRLFKEKSITIAGVPHGVGISKDVLSIFFEQTGLSNEYSNLMEEFHQAIRSKNKEKAIEIGKQISELIESVNDEKLKTYLTSKLDGGKKYAVRSSGIGEDGANHAFAGMAKTMLNVDKDNVYASVKEGWKSFFTDTCIEDMVKAGVFVQPALLVQEMVVDVKKAGVMFTRDNSGNLTIEGVLGLGEGLVSGRITPDHVIVRASDGRIEYRRALNNMIKIEEKAQGGTRVSKITDEERIERILDEKTIRQLQEIANILEEDAGYPVDIEFAIDKDNNIFVLQRRAITTFNSQDFINDISKKSSVPVIDQAVIDKTIKLLSYWTSEIKEIKDVINKLSDLPKDETERYDIIVKEIYNLLDILKKTHRHVQSGMVSSFYEKTKYCSDTDEFGKLCLENNLVEDEWSKKVSFVDFLIYTLIPFFNIEDVKNSGNPLFNSIIDYWFIEKEDRGGVVLGEMGTLIRFVYSINPNFVPYVVDKLLEKEIISVDKKIDNTLSRKINDYKNNYYDALKQYYFAVSSQENVDESLSKELKNIVKNLRYKLIDSITDEKRQKEVSLILSRIEELSNRVNNKNIALLQTSINDLFKIISKEDKQNMENGIVYMLPLFVCLAKGGDKIEDRDLERQLETIINMLQSSYDVNSDNKIFNDILDGLIGISKQFYNLNNSNSAKICNDIVKTILIKVYSPISNGTLDKFSSEYKKREDLFYTVFNKLNSEFPNNLGLFSFLFAKDVIRNPEAKGSYYYSFDNDKDENAYIYGPGLNKKTVQMYINTVLRSDRKNIVVPVPKRDSDIRDVEELVDLFISNYNFFDLSTFCRDLFKKEENGNAQQLAVAIIKKLWEKIEIENIGDKEKQKILSTLINMATSELYMFAQKYNFFDIDKLNELCGKYNLPYYLKAVTDSYVEFGNKRSTKGEYKLIHLLKYLPKDTFASISDIVQEPPIIYTFNGETKNNDEQVELIRNKFNTLKQVLNDNTLVLSLLDGLSKSKTPEKDMEELIGVLSNMIDSLSLINEKHGLAARIALDNIIKNLYSQENNSESNKIVSLNLNKIRQQIAIKQWSEDNLSEITELHTLINAVHQTSISDFKDTIEDITGSKSIKTISATHQNLQYRLDYLEQTGTEIYDLSENRLNPDIIDFIARLSQMHLPYPRAVDSKPNYQINDFVCMDNFLVWTTRLFVHSVDVFMNFAESDKTITITYHEGGRTVGNSERVKYFSTILKNLGFSVEADTKEGGDGVCSLKATLSFNYGLSEDADFIDIATKVVSLFKYSDMLDFDLSEYARGGGSYYESTFNGLVKKFMTGDIWFEYKPDQYKGWGDNLTAVPERTSLYDIKINEILKYLGLSENIPSRISQKDLDKYFNAAIERAFAVGRIILDKNHNLSKNKDYDVISYLAKAISLDEEESINKSRLINLVPRNKFKFKTVGYIGDLIAVSGYLKLENGSYLSVKGLINPATKRMKYSNVEIVTLQERRVVDVTELSTILREEGFNISKQEWISNTEQSRIGNLLHRRVQVIDTPEMRGIPTSSGNGTYVAGYITFDKNNVDENSIFVAPYTTPDDVERIKTAKAIITTSGGVLSHAAITTREYKTPSAIINGVNWHDNSLDVLYYSPVGEPFELETLSIRKVDEKNKTLKEGSIVLLNGETGHILLFDDIDDVVLKDLQKCIEKDDASGIKNILIDNADNENIKKLVEYVYFQTIGDSRMPNTLDMLFSSDMPQVIKDKIEELNEGYIQDKIRNINEAIENLEVVDNPNIAYSILQTLIDKLEFIKTPAQRQEMDMLKEEVLERTKKVKDNLFSFLSDLVKECENLIAKENLTQKDIDRIFNIIQQANVYNMFVSEKETNIRLKNIKRQIKQNIEKLEIKIKKYIELQNIMGKQILSLDNINSNDVYLFGSKTTELARMKKVLNVKENIVVPNGVGISCNVFELFFDMIEQKEKFLILSNSFEQAIKDGNLVLAQDFSQQIIDLMEEGRNELEKTEGLKKELSEVVLKTLGDSNYSVRSSGVGEDSANNAFAGMGETVLNVSKENLFDSLITCWESFYSERSIEYMINSKQIVRPAVLIQTMIDVEKSGVVFSRDKYGNVTIETLFGLGEGIVSGKITPDTITVNMANGDVLEYSVATKDYKISSTSEGIKRTLVEKGSKERTLNYKEIKELIDVVKLLEKDAGYAVDIEFGFKDGKIYILQRRPITTANNNNISKQENVKCDIQLSFAPVQGDQKVFVNIANPKNEEESIPVYFKMDKTADGYTYSYIVDSKYASMSDSIQEILFVRSNEDSVIRDKINSYLSVFVQAKEGKIEILPPLSDTIDTSEIEQNINMNMEGIRSLLASA